MIDTSQLLPYGAPTEVRWHVSRMIEPLGPGCSDRRAAVLPILNHVPALNYWDRVNAVEDL
jgi:hypothetical protein